MLADPVQAGRLASRGVRLAGLVAAAQPFLDHPERQVLITLGGENVAEPLDVGGVKPAVPGRRPGRRDEALSLQKPDLG